jgi:hypothetical protein
VTTSRVALKPAPYSIQPPERLYFHQVKSAGAGDGNIKLNWKVSKPEIQNHRGADLR